MNFQEAAKSANHAQRNWLDEPMSMAHAKEFIEIGPGKVLSGLIKRINNGVKIFNINSIKDIIDYKNQ